MDISYLTRKGEKVIFHELTNNEKEQVLEKYQPEKEEES